MQMEVPVHLVHAPVLSCLPWPQSYFWRLYWPMIKSALLRHYLIWIGAEHWQLCTAILRILVHLKSKILEWDTLRTSHLLRVMGACLTVTGVNSFSWTMYDEITELIQTWKWWSASWFFEHWITHAWNSKVHSMTLLGCNDSSSTFPLDSL